MDSSVGRIYRFQKKEHLRKGTEIYKLFSSGSRFSSTGGKLFLKKNSLEYSRIAFPLVKKYGNAIARNRSRRLSREVYRKLKPTTAPGYDLAFLVYPGYDNYKVREELLYSLMNKAKLILAGSL